MTSPNKGGDFQGKVKNLFNKYFYGKELDLDPEAFKDEAIWEKLV